MGEIVFLLLMVWIVSSTVCNVIYLIEKWHNRLDEANKRVADANLIAMTDAMNFYRDRAQRLADKLAEMDKE